MIVDRQGFTGMYEWVTGDPIPTSIHLKSKLIFARVTICHMVAKNFQHKTCPKVEGWVMDKANNMGHGPIRYYESCKGGKILRVVVFLSESEENLLNL